MLFPIEFSALRLPLFSTTSCNENLTWKVHKRSHQQWGAPSSAP